MLDDRAPHPHLGAGYPRAHDILTALCDMGHKVSFVPCVHTEARKEANKSLPERCKYLPLKSPAEIASYVEQHPHRYDALWVSRPHNMALLQRFLPQNHPAWKAYSLVIYDAEAIFALRAKAMKKYYPNMATGMSLESELGLTQQADVVAVVNHSEAGLFGKRGIRTVQLGGGFEPKALSTQLNRRKGFLFVGSLRDVPSPNSDALAWFCNTVAPLLRKEMGEEFQLHVAGMLGNKTLGELAAADIKLLGMVPDLSELYRSSRVFISPHRFAAGIPLKILEAANHGLPIVGSEILAQQLGWQNGTELMTAGTDSPEDFAAACLALYRDEELWHSVRANALSRLESDYSMAGLTASLRTILETRRN